jgi:hypothetical protein
MTMILEIYSICIFNCSTQEIMMLALIRVGSISLTEEG